MLIHHFRMLGQHLTNYYNMQDTVLAQLLYHLNTAHTNVVVSRVGPPSPDAGPALHQRLC